ncbi:hypothetical protein KEM54_004041 [Ascosphaera aggregata]|nr:hypothetical protein KEM54_004041 [Ascosphaera aggregata]
MVDPVRGIVVFSGGSAANSLVDVFNSVSQTKKCTISYVIPMSDNGGSSSELIRIFGGPGIGDVRSSELAAIKALVSHRLPPTAEAGLSEWLSIVDGTSKLWESISPAKKELIRSFLNLVNMEVLKRSRPPTTTFDYASASVGNMFLTGARLFSGSVESAIYMLATICSVPVDAVRVIPAINSNFSNHISASLLDGTVIVGQNNISHPSIPSSLDNSPEVAATLIHVEDDDNPPDSPYEAAEDHQLPGSLPSLNRKNIVFSKTTVEDFPSRISRVWYINPYGQEIRPPANPRVIDALSQTQTIVYSIGSLFTSLIPSIILKGVGKAIATSPARQKILILNGSIDRETGPALNPFTAVDFVDAIVQAGEQSRGRKVNLTNQTQTGKPPESAPLGAQPSPPALQLTRKPIPYRAYITHVLHLDGPGTPFVDRDELADRGIECLRLYGRKIFDDQGMPAGMHYDSTALMQALEVVMGERGDAQER